MEATHPHSSSNDNMTNALTGIFLLTGLSIRLMLVNPAQIYDVLFKLMSLVPVAMAIVINYPKFAQRVSSWRRKKPSKKRASK